MTPKSECDRCCEAGNTASITDNFGELGNRNIERPKRPDGRWVSWNKAGNLFERLSTKMGLEISSPIRVL